MARKFYIRVTGLALCFFRDDVWNIVFICDSDHHLGFKRTDQGDEDLHIKGRDLEINFTSAEGFIRQNDPFGDDFDVLLNLSEEYAHGIKRDAAGEPVLDASGEEISQLKIKRRNKYETDIVWMKLPESQLSVVDETDNDYFIQEQSKPGTPGGKPVEIIGKVGKEILVEFNVPKTAQLILTDPKDPGYKKPIPPFSGSSTVSLSFDNHCDPKCKYNDFVNLYDIVIDVDEKEDRQFAAGQIKSTFVNSKRIVPKFRRNKRKDDVESGNCDPSGSFPPPGGVWPLE